MPLSTPLVAHHVSDVLNDLAADANAFKHTISYHCKAPQKLQHHTCHPKANWFLTVYGVDVLHRVFVLQQCAGPIALKPALFRVGLMSYL